MKKERLKFIAAFGLVGIMLAGCQEKVDTSTENASAETAESTEHAHDHSQEHNHSHDDEKQEKINAGIFEDDEVKDRSLSDWEGDWQSVYPYLLDGSLDDVLQSKAKTNNDKTFEEYKEYYTVGYETDIERIVIEGNTMTFYKNGEGKTGEYAYNGYEILTYESGKKGVRYLFDLIGEADGAPKSVQFSDHIIAPTKSGHYHIYFGDENHDTLLTEMENWPTYFPSSLSGTEIAEEMAAH